MIDFFFRECYKNSMGVRIVFFDCDGTLTKVKSSWEYIHRRLNLWEDNADRFQRLFREGKIDYHQFCVQDALLWRGVPEQTVIEILKEIPYQDGARECVAGLRELGIYTVILSTGISLLVDHVRSDLGIDYALSNEILSHDGLLTGEINIHVHYDRKGESVAGLLREKGVPWKESCAVGDGEGDAGMFESVCVPVGFHPHPNLAPFLKHTICGGSLADLLDIVGGYP